MELNININTQTFHLLFMANTLYCSIYKAKLGCIKCLSIEVILLHLGLNSDNSLQEDISIFVIDIEVRIPK